MPLTAGLLKKHVAKEQRFVTAIALVCFGVVLLVGHCMHGISQPASPAIPPEKVFQQTLRDTMKDNVLSVNIPSLFFSFFMWSHQSPPATIQPQNGSWNLKRQEALFIKVYASFNQSLHPLLHRETSWMLFCKGVKVIFFVSHGLILNQLCTKACIARFLQ